MKNGALARFSRGLPLRCVHVGSVLSGASYALPDVTYAVASCLEAVQEAMLLMFVRVNLIRGKTVRVHLLDVWVGKGVVVNATMGK